MAMAMKKTGAAAKTMKAKRVATVARGRYAKALVLRGSKKKTTGGLTQEALMRNKRGKVVSKRASAAGKRAYRRIENWVEALMHAREALHVRGFVAINGRSLQGKALYVKTKALYHAGQAPLPSPARASEAPARLSEAQRVSEAPAHSTEEPAARADA
mmetsp:Transcript_59357/g.165750  ORF Transcript_59357/g.165750 Transcript_59357/m.165750 type:complete len:158 (-) Transcript_59357:122-595(-)